MRLSEPYVGGSQQLHLGAAPRALLAFDEDELLPPLLAAGAARRTEHSIVDPEELRADLAQTRERGFSISDEDVPPDVAAIGVGGPRTRLMPPLAEHISCLLQASHAISTEVLT